MILIASVPLHKRGRLISLSINMFIGIVWAFQITKPLQCNEKHAFSDDAESDGKLPEVFFFAERIKIIIPNFITYSYI